MSLLLLFHPREDETPAPTDTPLRTLLGVGLTLGLLFTPVLINTL